MSTSAVTTLTVVQTGDVTGTQTETDTNVAASGQNQIVNLSSGANTITVPTGGTTPTSVIIIPPSGNAVSITFKGVTGDTGVRLHNTVFSRISLDSSVTTFCLTAGSAITGVRLIYT